MEAFHSLFGDLPSETESLDSESIHHLRKGTKQLRAKLHLLRQIKGRSLETEQLRQSVKELARMLAGQRDADVMFSLLQNLACESQDPELLSLYSELQRGLAGTRLPKSDIHRIRQLMTEITKSKDKFLVNYPETSEVNKVLENSLQSLYEKGLLLLNDTAINWDTLHDWRKQVKKLMYQFQMKRFPSPRDQTIHDHLEKLGERLGQINDIKILYDYAKKQQLNSTRAKTLQSYIKLFSLLNDRRHQLLIQTRNLLAEINSLL